MAATIGAVIRGAVGASIGYGLLFACSLPFGCLLGVPPALVLLALLGRQLDGVIVGHARERDRKLRGFLVVYLFILLATFATFGGASVAQMLLPMMAEDPRFLLGAMVALTVTFAIALPYAFVPLVQRDDEVPAGVGGNAFVIAAQAMTRLPLPRRLALVAVAVLAQAIPLGFFTFLEGPDRWLEAIGSAAFAYGVLVPLAAAHYVAAYASVRDGLEQDPLEDDPVAVPPSLRASGISALLAALVLVFVVAQALLVPLPMATEPAPTEPLSLVPSAEPVRLGEAGVLVRSAGRGVTVAARDGGGAGFVPADCAEVDWISVAQTGTDAYRITALCDLDGTVRVLRIDGRGVRLDDSFADRLGARVGGWLWGLVALSVLLWLLAFGGPWRSFQRARFLRSLRRTDELEHAPGVRVLEGRLHAPEGLTLAAGRFRTAGSAQVSGGDLRITLPADGPALGQAVEALADGAPVAIVGDFAALVGGGFREGPAPWPEDGWLVPGDRRAAAERLTRPAARRLGLLFAALTLAQLVAAASLVLTW